MRILSVELKGFGPFKDAQRVDFSAFDDSGIFLIGGRTGAGKSTILDGICFALYGSVPRYDGYGGAMRLRSDHCEIDDVTEVTLSFEVDAERYRIVRSPEFNRPKSRGPGITRQAASVELSVQTAYGWEALETKIPEAARRIAEIVKLDKGQFLQVILLAQNRFQEFLEAESKERQSLLRTLFGTQRYEQYSEALQARAQELGAELLKLTRDSERTVTDLASELGAEPPWESSDPLSWAVGRVAGAVEALADAQSAEAQALTDAQAASQELTAATQLAARQQRRGAAEQQLAALEGRADGYNRAKRQMEAAVRAAEVKPRAQEADTTALALKDALALEALARDAAGSVPDSDLSGFVAGNAQTIGALAPAIEAELQLSGLEQADGSARATLEAHHEATANIDVRRSLLREQLIQLGEAESSTALAATDLSVAQAVIAAARLAYAAAVELVEIEEEVTRLQQAELDALQARTTAGAKVDRVLATQLHGRAALLAQTLVDGQPCAVCGALEHPSPAEFDGEPVSDAEVADARAAYQRAAGAAELASRALNTAQARAAERRGSAGGRTIGELDAELRAGQARVEAASAAQVQLEALSRRRVEILELQRGLEEEERTGGARSAELAQAAALAAKAYGDAQALIDRSLDGHQSVAARVEALRHKQAVVERLIAAQSCSATALTASGDAEKALSAQLSRSGFTDRSAAELAMLEPERFASLAKAIRAYEDGLTETLAVLGQPDLQHLPAEPADVASASARAAASDALRIARTEQRVALEGRTKRGHDLIAKLRGELESASDLDGEFKVIDVLARATRGEAPNQLGIPLESFVLAAELEEIVDAANGRLATMSQGRYTIEHSDERTRGGKRTGLEIVIYDAHTGATRSPRSLSGGEKFLASLALALGLAEVVTNRAGGIQLDTLFIDEGFGALDNETLELAMHTLDELRQGGRTVGLISHVEAMKDQIPAKLLVGIADGGWSVIDQTE